MATQDSDIFHNTSRTWSAVWNTVHMMCTQLWRPDNERTKTIRTPQRMGTGGFKINIRGSFDGRFMFIIPVWIAPPRVILPRVSLGLLFLMLTWFIELTAGRLDSLMI